MTWSPNIPITEAHSYVKTAIFDHFHQFESFCDWDVWAPSHFCSLLWWGRLLGTLKHSFSNLVLSPRCLWHCAICTIFNRFAVLTFSFSSNRALWLLKPIYWSSSCVRQTQAASRINTFPGKFRRDPGECSNFNDIYRPNRHFLIALPRRSTSCLYLNIIWNISKWGNVSPFMLVKLESRWAMPVGNSTVWSTEFSQVNFSSFKFIDF